jgi:uncharacterized phage protein (TIGR01671 family)
MREILFRGKRIDNDEWVYGDLVQSPAHGVVQIYEQDLCGDNFAVDPSTIGQYTGLTDKNGKKIFEGDIVKVHANDSYFDDCWGWRDHWVDVVCFVVYDRGRLQFNKRPADKYYSEFVINHKEENLEIIGSIHDNPELLEDKPDD